MLGSNAGDQHRLRGRQIVVRRFAVKNLRLADNIELCIGTDGGELRRAIQRRMGAEGFIVVKEEGWLLGFFIHGSHCP